MNNKPFANLRNMLDTAAGKPSYVATAHGTAAPVQHVASYDAGIKMNRMFRNMTEGGKHAVDAAIEAQLSIPFGSHAKDEWDMGDEMVANGHFKNIKLGEGNLK